MKRPCPVSLCECPGVDAPITNISAEAPDPLLFWGQIWNPYNPYKQPPLGNGLDVKVDCDVFNEIFSIYDPIVYAGTQLMANLQALAASLGCPWPPSGTETFTNDEQSQTVYCPDGSSFTYTVAAGTMTSPPMDAELGAAWVEWANAWAAAYAFQQASALLQCIVPGDEEDVGGGDGGDGDGGGGGDGGVPTIPPGDDPPIPPSGPGVLSTPLWCCSLDEVNQAYTVTGATSVTYNISIVAGAIPPGTTLTQTGPRTVRLTGFPTVPGDYNFTIRGVSVTIPTMVVEATIYFYVMGITNADSLPDAEIATAYSQVLVGAGGTAPYTFALDSGSTLPDTFVLDPDGTLHSAGPTTAGDFTFDVVLTDATGGECLCTVNLVVANQIIDWSTMVWVTAENSFPPTTIGIVVPPEPGGVQDNFEVYCSGPNFISTADASATGTINYTGPAVPIHIAGDIICTPVGTQPPNPPVGYLRVWTTIGAAPSVLTVLVSNAQFPPPGCLPMATGPYSVPFTIPDTGGENCVIRIDAVVDSGFDLFFPGNYEMRITGTITND